MLRISSASKLFMVITGVVFAGSVFVADIPKAQAEEQSTLAEGARLYDKWYKVIKADKPKVSHPALSDVSAYGTN